MYWREDRKVWRDTFEIDKRRFSFQTKTKSKTKAEQEFVKYRMEVEAELEQRKRTGKVPLTLDKAADLFWTEKGQFHADDGKTHTDLKRVVEYLGPAKLLDEITDSDVARMVAWRRAQRPTNKAKSDPDALVKPATVNRSTTEVLKKIFTHAKGVHRHAFPHEPNWKKHMLKEPDGIVRELRGDEEQLLDDAMRSDYAAYFEFALQTGRRRASTIIRWSDVNFQAGLITTKGKGDHDVVTKITAELAALLEPLKGHHEEFVFTYEAKRTNPRAGTIKGKRYPITYEGGKTEWQRLVQRAGLKSFRFHDLRHTYATRLQRLTGDIVLVSKALGHRDIKTTARYAHVNQTDVGAASQILAEERRARRAARKAEAAPGGTPAPTPAPNSAPKDASF